MTREKFIEAFNDLSDSEKISLFNKWASEHQPDDMIWEFTDEFFDRMFSSAADAVRACFIGDIKNWSDEYLRFNGYANLVSMTEYEAAEWVTDFVDEIFEDERVWSNYIDEDDYEDEDE